MAVKTITITKEAYDALARAKEKHESFSDAILRITGRQSLRRFIGALSKEEGDRLAKSVDESRRESKRLDTLREQKLRRMWRS
jgi:predicted CopG family antitoxin